MSNYKMKCLLMGDQHIDTWGLIKDYINCSFNKKYKYILGCDIGSIDISLQQNQVIFSIWDLATIDRFNYFRPLFYRGAQCAIIIFDLARYETFNPIALNFIREIYSTIGPIPISLIGYNNDKTKERQIDLEIINQLCEEIPIITYFEVHSNDKGLISALESAAKSALYNLTHTDEYRKISNEFIRRMFKDLILTLEEMGYNVNENDEVEILTHRGFFSVNILNSRVIFESLKCTNCINHNCHFKHYPRKKSLCIVSRGLGYSNVGLNPNHLLVLAKIYAITKDILPAHIINQISELTNCPNYIDPDDQSPFNNLTKNSENVLPPYFSENTHENFPVIYETLNTNYEAAHLQDIATISPAKAQTLLRNHQIQLYEGRLPYSVYKVLEERYKKIIHPA